MAMNNGDFVDALGGLLRAAGYVIHNGNAETGETVDDESGADWWFTWTVDGMADCECGPTCAGSLEALESAAAHWFANARVPMADEIEVSMIGEHVTLVDAAPHLTEIDDDTGAPVLLPMHLLIPGNAYWLEEVRPAVPGPALHYLMTAPRDAVGAVQWEDATEVDEGECANYREIVQLLQANI